MNLAISVGHGLADPGAINGDLYEHLEAYKVAWHLREALAAMGHTVEPVNCFQPLSAKIREINTAHAIRSFDLALEIHFNSATDPQANGTEVLFYSRKNEALASRVSTGLANALGTRDRGAVKRENLGFLKQTLPPALIIEVLFITSPVDTSGIDVTFHRRAAEAISASL